MFLVCGMLGMEGGKGGRKWETYREDEERTWGEERGDCEVGEVQLGGEGLGGYM